LSDDTINGDLDLTEVQVRGIPIVITDSTLKGDVVASNVTFADTVDISGSIIDGNFDIGHAMFQRDALFNSITVNGDLQARLARSRQRFTLASAQVFGTTHLDGAVLDEGFNAEQAFFHGDAYFNSASISGDVLLSGASFEQQLVLVRVSAASGMDLRTAKFNSDVLFTEASISGTLNLSDTTFFPEPVQGDALADPRACTCFLKFLGASVGSLLMTDATIHRGEIWIKGARFAALTMDRDLVDDITGLNDQVGALQSIEDTARNNGDTGLANEASFDGDVLNHSDDSFFWKWMVWWPFGEQIGGYLVKPLRPARAMVALAVSAAALRIVAMAIDRRRAIKVSSAGGANFRWWFGTTASAVGEALSVAVNPKPPSGTLDIGKIEDIEKSDPKHVLGAVGLWAEWGAQKALNAVLVIALGNAIPGFKEVVDSILKR